MKACPTCGMSAEDRAPFCPCCGSSFVESRPTPTPPPPVAKKPAKPAHPPLKLEEEKEGGHGRPIAIIAVLAVIAVTLGALWATGGLAAIFKKDTKTNPSASQAPDVQPLPTIAATYGNGQELTTQQYLAYLDMAFEYLYYYQGVYNYPSYGIDPWEETFPYGADNQQLLLSDYILSSTQDTIKRQIVLSRMMKNNGLSWIEEDENETNQALLKLEDDYYIEYGFDNDSYAYALKNINLNERSTFYGLYKTGGARAVSELDLRQYFVTNYLSYKMIQIPLTDDRGTALDPASEEYEAIWAKMSDYMTTCQNHDFNTAYVLHTGKPAEESRVDVDATTIGTELAEAVRTVSIGDVGIVEYTDNGVPTLALIQRLDVYDSDTLFEDSIEDILYAMHYEAFDAEVDEAVAQLSITFDEQVVSRCKPRDFLNVNNAK